MTDLRQVGAVSIALYTIAYKVKLLSFLSCKHCLENMSTEIPFSQNMLDKTILTGLTD